jgi:hypothetical protein
MALAPMLSSVARRATSRGGHGIDVLDDRARRSSARRGAAAELLGRLAFGVELFAVVQDDVGKGLRQRVQAERVTDPRVVADFLFGEPARPMASIRSRAGVVRPSIVWSSFAMWEDSLLTGLKCAVTVWFPPKTAPCSRGVNRQSSHLTHHPLSDVE